MAGKLNAKLSCRKSAAESAEALLTGAQMLDPAQCSKVLRCCTNIAILHMPDPVSVRHLALKQLQGLGKPRATRVIERRTAVALLSEEMYELQDA